MKGHKRTHKLIKTTRKNKIITQNDGTYIYGENDNYKRKMCQDCKFFINNNCIKNRIQIQCARKGQKNKE